MDYPGLDEDSWRPPFGPRPVAHPPITLIAYGSLMSGLGIAGLGTLPALEARRVRLHNGRRGFGKLSQYGDRYAMIVEALRPDEPLHTGELTESSQAQQGFEALALTISLADFARVAVREGYRAEAVWTLAEHADAAGETAPAYLWRLLEGSRFDVSGYRRALCTEIGYTSAHYIPHPVAMAAAPPALTFLAPGAEGSGSDTVVPVRVQGGERRVLSLAEAWRLKPNPGQLEYFTMCLLAEVHHLSLADVLDGVAAEPRLVSALRDRIAVEWPEEPARFVRLLGLSQLAYRTKFQPENRPPGTLRP